MFGVCHILSWVKMTDNEAGEKDSLAKDRWVISRKDTVCPNNLNL